MARWTEKKRVPGSIFRLLRIPGDHIYVLDDNPKAIHPFFENGILFVQGFHFRYISGIQSHLEAIRTFFRPIRKHRERVASRIAEVRRECDFLVGVHIRRGDYKEFRGGRYFYEIDIYRTFMEQIARMMPDQRRSAS